MSAYIADIQYSLPVFTCCCHWILHSLQTSIAAQVAFITMTSDAAHLFVMTLITFVATAACSGHRCLINDVRRCSSVCGHHDHFCIYIDYLLHAVGTSHGSDSNYWKAGNTPSVAAVLCLLYFRVSRVNLVTQKRGAKLPLQLHGPIPCARQLRGALHLCGLSAAVLWRLHFPDWLTLHDALGPGFGPGAFHQGPSASLCLPSTMVYLQVERKTSLPSKSTYPPIIFFIKPKHFLVLCHSCLGCAVLSMLWDCLFVLFAFIGFSLSHNADTHILSTCKSQAGRVAEDRERRMDRRHSPCTTHT